MSWLLTHDHHFVVHKLNFESTEQSGIMFHAIKLGLHIKDNNSKRFVDKTKIVDAQRTTILLSFCRPLCCLIAIFRRLYEDVPCLVYSFIRFLLAWSCFLKRYLSEPKEL